VRAAAWSIAAPVVVAALRILWRMFRRGASGDRFRRITSKLQPIIITWQKINRSHAHAYDSRIHDSRTNHSHKHRASNGTTTLNENKRNWPVLWISLYKNLGFTLVGWAKLVLYYGHVILDSPNRQKQANGLTQKPGCSEAWPSQYEIYLYRARWYTSGSALARAPQKTSIMNRCTCMRTEQ